MIVPQNMPGGGSFVAAKFMNEAAPKDGTVFGSLAQTLALDSMINTTAKIDVTQVQLSRPRRHQHRHRRGAAAERHQDVRGRAQEAIRRRRLRRRLDHGAVPVRAQSPMRGAKFKIVRGYKGTTDIILAMERGEVDIVGAYGLPGILVSQPGWVHKRRSRHPLCRPR